MNTNLEDFLEEAFDAVKPTSANIGRVVVTPDYEVELNRGDAPALADQLQRALADLPSGSVPTLSPEGYEIQIPQQFGLLKKYIRQISLHSDPVEGAWVEVAPPGNWI